MLTRSRSDTMPSHTDTHQSSSSSSPSVSDSQTPPHITFIHEAQHLPPFTGDSHESVHSFLQRVDEECTRRLAHSDKERLSILKSRISYEPHSIAGMLVHSDKFTSLSSYDEFSSQFRDHFQSHSHLGASHSLHKVSKAILQHARSHSNPFRAENIASSLSSELVTQLESSDWFSGDSLPKDDLKRLLAYLLFTTFLDNANFQIASTINFKKHDYVYDVCKIISEKQPVTSQPVTSHPVHALTQNSPELSSVTHRGRSHNRSHSPRRFHSRSHSRSRRAFCSRCKCPGHYSDTCRVVLDSRGKRPYNSHQFCSFHNRVGHSLQDCRQYNAQLHVSDVTPSKNEYRSSQASPS